MKKETDSHNRFSQIYQSFTGLSNFAETQEKIGETGFSHFLEDFFGALFGIVYGGEFRNLNTLRPNFPGIDLFDNGTKTGLQVTTSKPSKPKITHTLLELKDEKTLGVSRVFIIFGTINKKCPTYKIRRPFVPFRGLTLFDIYWKIEGNPALIDRVYDLCQSWLYGESWKTTNHLGDLFAPRYLEIVSENEHSGKILPKLYVENATRKDVYRAFCSTSFYVKAIHRYFDQIIQTRDYAGLLQMKAVPDAKTIKDESICAFLKLVGEQEEKWNFGGMTDEERTKELNEVGLDRFNGDLVPFVREIRPLLEISSKSAIAMIGDAGCGKTAFLCDFISTFISGEKIPTIFLITSECVLAGTSYLSKVVETIISCVPNFSESTTLALLDQYLEISQEFLIIVIDAVNETNNLQQVNAWLQELARFVREHKRYKLIISSRQDPFNSFFSRTISNVFNESVFIDEHFAIDSQSKLSFPLLKRYFSSFEITQHLSKESIDLLLSNKVFLRIFCVCYQGKDCPSETIDLPRMLLRYLEDRGVWLADKGFIDDKENFRFLLLRIGERIYRASMPMSFDIADFSDPEKKVIRTICDNDVLIRREESEESGSPLCLDSYSFVFQSLRDVVVANWLITQNDSKFTLAIQEVCSKKEYFDLLFPILILTKGTDKDLGLINPCVYPIILFRNFEWIDDGELTSGDVAVIFKTAMENQTNFAFFVKQVIWRTNESVFKNISLSLFFLFLSGPEEISSTASEWFRLFITNEYPNYIFETLASGPVDETDFDIGSFVSLLGLYGIAFESRSRYIPHFYSLIDRLNHLFGSSLDAFIQSRAFNADALKYIQRGTALLCGGDYGSI